MTRYILEDCLNTAKLKKGVCLSTEYKSTTVKMIWKCEKNHQWSTTYKIIKKGSWCPECAKTISRIKRKGTKNRTITIEYCRTLAEEKKGKCLSKKYKSGVNLLWECEKKHQWESRIDRVQRGRWCCDCYLLKVKPPIEKYKIYAISKGGECLSDKYIDSKTKLKWKCKRNHIWESKPRTDFWCRECFIIDSYIITIEDCKQFALNNQGKCLSMEYKSGYKILWECEKNHQWESVFNGNKYTGWCRDCINIKQIKYTIDDCIISAIKKDGECLSKEFNNVGTSMQWKCKKGHIFKTRYAHILEGSWCKTCWGIDQRLGLLECIDWAKKLDGECLSTEYVNKDTKMKWKCKKDHIWIATFGSLRSMNSWCPYCSKSRSEKLCREILEEYTGLPFPSIRPDWLKNVTGYNLELDGFCEDLNFGFEYQGIQHDEYNAFFHRNDQENFERQQDRDKLKLDLCKKHNIDVLIIPHTLSYQNENELRIFIKEELIKRLNCEFLFLE